MRTYLIHHNSKGRIVEMDSEKRSEDYGKLQEDFAKDAGKDPRKADNYQFADMICLHEDYKAENVYYDYDLVSHNGAHFTLISLPDTTAEQLEAAKKQIRRDHDVVGMSVVHIKELI